MNYQKNGFSISFRASHRLAHDYRNAVAGLVYNTGCRELTLTGGVQRTWGGVRLWLTVYDNCQEIPDDSRDSLSRARPARDGAARQNRFYAVGGAETTTAGYPLLGAGVGSTLRTRAGREAGSFSCRWITC